MSPLLAILLLLGIVTFQSGKIHDWHKQAIGLNAQLQAITTKRNEQHAETAERIKVVTKTIHDADGRAKVVEAAPLPGNCATPSQVMRADL